MGVDTTCIGTLGEKGTEVYDALAEDCEVYSIAAHGRCTALEFKDGKVMLAENESMQIGPQDILDNLGQEKLRELLSKNDLLCLVNWSELFRVNQIWRMMLTQFQSLENHPSIVFFDLSDLSARTQRDVQECAALMAEYARLCRVVLGLNENEARILAQVLGIRSGEIAALGRKLYEKLGVQDLVIHTNRDAYGFSHESGYAYGKAFVAENPVALTGGGDNFNAGFCTGLLADLPLESCILLGNAASGYYVRHGKNTSYKGLLDFAEEYLRSR